MAASDRPAPRAVLFDIDGTLVDSNYLHVEAWHRAFGNAGCAVEAWRIHRAIGMDSGRLLDSVLDAEHRELGEAVKKLHSEYLAQLAPRLRPFPGARDLLRALAGRGLAVVLCSSARPDELRRLRRVLDSDDVVTAVTAAEDVERAKPDPEVIEVALRRAGALPGEAVMVGDAVWDVEAAGRAGVPCVGLRSGGTSAADLRDSGAIAVYDDVAQLLSRLEGSPLVPAPQPAAR